MRGKEEKKRKGKEEKKRKIFRDQIARKKIHAHLFPLHSRHFLDQSEICYLE